jgi:hypothetical protein
MPNHDDPTSLPLIPPHRGFHIGTNYTTINLWLILARRNMFNMAIMLTIWKDKHLMDCCCTSQLDATNPPSKLSTWLGLFPRYQVFLLSVQTHMAINGSTLTNGVIQEILIGLGKLSCS